MPAILPYRYRFAHDYAIFLHDLIVGMLKSGIDSEVFDTRVPLAEGQVSEFTELQGAALYSWLEENATREVLLETDYKLLIPAMVGDFCHYVLEALNASRKGKLTVAFTLLRKPFQDNLFYLEWMLADLPDFFDRFWTQSAKDLSVKDLPVERRKEIISGAIAALPNPHTIDASFIYDVRYNRAASYSLAGLADKAIHLVTINAHLLTAPRDFNFIFFDPEEFEEHLHHIYLVVPQLLYHALHVIDTIMSQLAKWDEGWNTWVRIRRDIGFLLYMDSIVKLPPELVEVARESLQSLLAAVAPVCPKCGNEFSLHLRNMRQLCVHGTLRCRTCKDTVQFEFDGTSAEE